MSQEVMPGIGYFRTIFAKIGPFQVPGFNVSFDTRGIVSCVIASCAM